MYFDIHLHASAWDAELLSLDDVAAWMDDHKVERSIVLQFERTLPRNDEERERMVENFRRFRGRIDPFCTIPFDSDASTADMVRLLTREKEDGAIGYGELYFEGYCDGPEYMRLYEACAEVGLPVLFHLGPNEEGLPHLASALKGNPNCTFIAHAPGWWKHIHAGTCERLLKDYPNLYGDLSAGSGARAISTDLDFGREFLVRNAEKLMFGTDAILCKPELPDEPAIQFSLFESLDLHNAIKQKIYRDNANAMFPIPA